jgi:hypothetical protein
MKKLFLVILAAGSLTACNNSSETAVDQKVDSLNDRKDTLKEQTDSSFNAKIDSLKDRRDDLKQKFDSSIEAKKDSVKGKKS